VSKLDTSTIGFWYASKSTLFAPGRRMAVEFIACDTDLTGERQWTALSHYPDSNFYWKYEMVDLEDPIQNPRWPADPHYPITDRGEPMDRHQYRNETQWLCQGAYEHGGVCPYLDEPCNTNGDLIYHEPEHEPVNMSFTDAEGAMYIWLNTRGYRNNGWEIIKRD